MKSIQRAWKGLLGIIVVLSWTPAMRAQILSHDIISDAYCTDFDYNHIPITTDGQGNWICEVDGDSNNAFLSLQIIGLCEDNSAPAASQYAYVDNCQFGPYYLQVTGYGKYYDAPEYDECGDLEGYNRVGYVEAVANIESPLGEPISNTYSSEDCLGDVEQSSPGSVTGSSC